ncbi:MAG: hypothetical protein JWR26_956 [Pedosphaera sp.]|nr:hypothetical protein [Pedosphaera sp.]
MKPSRPSHKKPGMGKAFLCVCLLAAQFFWSAHFAARAQDSQNNGDKKDPGKNPTSPPESGSGTTPQPAAEAPSPAKPAAEQAAEKVPAVAGKEAPAKAEDAKVPPNGDITISFQGANIDMIVQWLAETTGKSVVKHPRVQCQLTIVSSKKVSPREAVTLVFRALALEGFSAIETGKSILIVPEGQEPKMSPEMVDVSKTEAPMGRQRQVKIFTLKYTPATALKEKIKGVLSEKATIEADDVANRIIVTDYGDNIAVLGDLIVGLDTDKPEDVAVRVLPLKHVSAQDLLKEVAPLYQKISGKAQKEIIEVTADERANSLIVLSSELNYLGIQKLLLTLDTEDAQEKAMRAFPLKNADAQDVAKQLKDLSQDSDNNSRYPYFFYSSMEQNKSTKKLSVVADKRRNTLIVQAAPASLDGIGKMIAALDEPVTDDSLAPKIYTLKYVNAADIEDVLNELFLKKQQQRNYWNSFYGDGAGDDSERGAGRLYGKVRITSESYSNAIIVTSNSAENLAAVEDILRQLDVPSQAGESTFRVGLRFAKASTVANSINILFAKGGSPPQRPVVLVGQQGYQQAPLPQQPVGNSFQNNFELEQETKEEGYFPWLGGQPENTRTPDGRNAARPVSDLVGRVRVVPDQRSNSLLISANVHFFPQVTKLIEDLDQPTAEVLIEARIVEVSSDFLDKLGVRWSPNGSTTFTADDFDNSILAHGSANTITGFGGKTTVNTSIGSALPNALASLRSGVLDSTVSLDYLVQFLRKNTDATVLAAPQINIEDNESGKIFVGQQVPFINSTLTTDVGGQNVSFTYRDVGVILEVTPHINNAGDVALKIHAESSAIVPGQTLLGGAIIDTRNFKTDLTARDGETLVLGGIIQKQISDTLRKTPLLGSIPGLGWAFKKRDKTSHEVELMVFLRPKVVRTPQQAKELLEEVDQKAPLVKKWQDDFQSDKEQKAKALPKK